MTSGSRTSRHATTAGAAVTEGLSLLSPEATAVNAFTEQRDSRLTKAIGVENAKTARNIGHVELKHPDGLRSADRIEPRVGICFGCRLRDSRRTSRRTGRQLLAGK